MKVAQIATLDLARCVIDFSAGEHIDELCSYHSQYINPNELTVPPCLFGTATTCLKTTFPNVKLAILIEAYSPEGAIQKTRPVPYVCDHQDGRFENPEQPSR